MKTEKLLVTASGGEGAGNFDVALEQCSRVFRV